MITYKNKLFNKIYGGGIKDYIKDCCKSSVMKNYPQYESCG